MPTPAARGGTGKSHREGADPRARRRSRSTGGTGGRTDPAIDRRATISRVAINTPEPARQSDRGRAAGIG